METLDLIALAENCPGTTISVKLSDLLEAGRSFKEELLRDLNASQLTSRREDDDDCITREEVMRRLKVSSATLWRWKKCGYLVPVQLGSFDRYRVADIEAFMSRKGGAK